MVDRIVINTGPLIALSKAEALEVIGRLPIEFVCPDEVRKELDEGTASGHLPVVPAWLRVVSLSRPPHPVARAALDLGEAAVIELALSQRIDRVCIDDWRGRRTALALGLQVTGTLGLLGRAKKLGLLPSVRPWIERLTEVGVWYDAELIRTFLASLDEG